jgi:SAM-dependent methyltransferase
MNNELLYREKSVIGKYASKTTRVRQLNNPERSLIDYYQLWDKDILVLGSGAGRVPANLLLFGNRVTGIELSPELHNAALNDYPPELYGNLTLMNADARDLGCVEDASFDCVFFPMNGIDLAPTLEDREKILGEMYKKVRRGGVLAFTSHNITAYAFSRKVSSTSRRISALRCSDYMYQKENVVGGGHLFKGSEKFVICHTENITSARFDNVFCDCRDRLDNFSARFPMLRHLNFPYIMYAFKKV